MVDVAVIINGRVDASGLFACVDSVRRASLVLDSERNREAFAQFWDIGNTGQLATAVLAEDGMVVLEPTEAVGIAFAAIRALHPDIEVSVFHSWPILSLVSDNTAIADGEGAANLPVGDHSRCSA